MKAVITVIGKDREGIIAAVSSMCAAHRVNIIDITQKVMDGIFVMMMIVSLESLDCKFTEFVDIMSGLGTEMGLEVHTMHEDVFNAMHRI